MKIDHILKTLAIVFMTIENVKGSPINDSLIAETISEEATPTPTGKDFTKTDYIFTGTNFEIEGRRNPLAVQKNAINITIIDSNESSTSSSSEESYVTVEKLTHENEITYYNVESSDDRVYSCNDSKNLKEIFPAETDYNNYCNYGKENIVFDLATCNLKCESLPESSIKTTYPPKSTESLPPKNPIDPIVITFPKITSNPKAIPTSSKTIPITSKTIPITSKTIPNTLKTLPITSETLPASTNGLPTSVKANTVRITNLPPKRTSHSHFRPPKDIMPASLKISPITSKTSPITSKTSPITSKTIPNTLKTLPITSKTIPNTLKALPITSETNGLPTSVKANTVRITNLPPKRTSHSHFRPPKDIMPASLKISPITSKTSPITSKTSPITSKTIPNTLKTLPITSKTIPNTLKALPITSETNGLPTSVKANTVRITNLPPKRTSHSHFRPPKDIMPAFSKTSPITSKTIPNTLKTLPITSETLPASTNGLPTSVKANTVKITNLPPKRTSHSHFRPPKDIMPAFSKTSPITSKTIPIISKTIPNTLKTLPITSKTLPAFTNSLFTSVETDTVTYTALPPKNTDTPPPKRTETSTQKFIVLSKVLPTRHEPRPIKAIPTYTRSTSYGIYPTSVLSNEKVNRSVKVPLINSANSDSNDSDSYITLNLTHYTKLNKYDFSIDYTDKRYEDCFDKFILAEKEYNLYCGSDCQYTPKFDLATCSLVCDKFTDNAECLENSFDYYYENASHYFEIPQSSITSTKIKIIDSNDSSNSVNSEDSYVTIEKVVSESKVTYYDIKTNDDSVYSCNENKNLEEIFPAENNYALYCNTKQENIIFDLATCKVGCKNEL